jgi:hypothetical protein
MTDLQKQITILTGRPELIAKVIQETEWKDATTICLNPEFNLHYTQFTDKANDLVKFSHVVIATQSLEMLKALYESVKKSEDSFVLHRCSETKGLVTYDKEMFFTAIEENMEVR